MIRSLYLYAVSLITLIMAITGGITLFNSVANIVSPNTYFMAYTDYKQSFGTEINDKNKEIKKTDAQLANDYDSYKKEEIEREKNSAINSLIGSLGLIIIPLPIFYLFQRKITLEKSNTVDEKTIV